MCPAMQYCAVITNPRWRTAAILKIAKSQYLSEKSSDFDKIWYTTADNEPAIKSPYLSKKLSDFVETWCTASAIEPDDSHVTKN